MERIIMRYSQRAGELAGRLKREIEEKAKEFCPPIFFSPLKDSLLGQYSPSDDCITLNERLLELPYETIYQVALHELAHRINHILNGSLEHDASFREICTRLGVDEGYEKARVTIKGREGVLDKVRKLKALSASPFEAESQSAMRKVRQLMASYSLEEEGGAEDAIYMCDLVIADRNIALKEQILARLACVHTGAYLVRIHVEDTVRLRAYGKAEELEVADYLMDVLRMAIESELATRRHGNAALYRGITGTNSFYEGVYEAIMDRINFERAAGDAASRALIAIGEDNERKAKELVFSNVRIVKKNRRITYNRSVYEQGKAFGKKLEVKKGIKTGQKGPKALPGQSS